MKSHIVFVVSATVLSIAFSAPVQDSYVQDLLSVDGQGHENIGSRVERAPFFPFFVLVKGFGVNTRVGTSPVQHTNNDSNNLVNVDVDLGGQKIVDVNVGGRRTVDVNVGGQKGVDVNVGGPDENGSQQDKTSAANNVVYRKTWSYQPGTYVVRKWWGR